MATEELISVLIIATFTLMHLSERKWPARRFPTIAGWTWIGVGALVLAAATGALVPMALPMAWISAHSLLPGQRLGVIGGVLVGYPCVALVGAIFHRGYHHYSSLWRWVHQFHHCPIRMDIPGSVLFHPFDLILNNLQALAVTIFVLGLKPEAAAWTGFVAIFYGMFQHWNVHTPQWIGYLIQRPESHCIHHQRNLHAYNYSDFPLWDMLAGSFRNPQTHSGVVGFEPTAAARIGAMLYGRDVNPALDRGGGGGTA